MPKPPRQTWYPDYYVTPFLPAHRNTDPSTSAEADIVITNSGDRASLMAQCLRYIQDNPDETAGEISAALGLNSWQVSKRLSDLKNKGQIAPSGARLFKGRKQQTWKEIQYMLPLAKQTFWQL